MEIDAATRRNLELVQTMSGGRDGSVLSAIDRTLTGPGGRLLAAQLAAPLTKVETIRRRHDAVAWFVNETRERESVRRYLRETTDMERAMSRLTLERGSPRDLGALRNGLSVASALRAQLQAADPHVQNLAMHWQILETIVNLFPSFPARLMMTCRQFREMGVLFAGYAAELDELRQLRDDSRKHIANLQARYSKETGIFVEKSSQYPFGYFIEVTRHRPKRCQVVMIAFLFIARRSRALRGSRQWN